ncbi:MAG: hypothetical protein J7513_02470 [Solirubrobacteraceae bacterium]|nr:hypothetical protein [Solirubrobacteraceae bacterium]
MADDRLDDAIDAVVRAVDRIERATRRQAVVEEAHALEAAAPAEAPAEPHVDARTPVTSVSPGRDAWAPVFGGAGDGEEREPEPEPEPERPREKRAERDDDRPRKKDKHKKKDADAELHELVGRIVVRTQELDDHLLASRALRDEISELVARLAAAADHRR